MKPPVYATGRFELRPYLPGDLERFIETGTQEDVIRYMGGTDEDPEVERKMFAKILSIYEKSEEDRWFWIWAISDQGKMVGHFELKETQYTNEGELEIVYMIHPEERRRGIMKDVLGFLKEQQHLWNRRIIATVSPQNLPSLSLLDSWGIEYKKTIEEPDSEGSFYKLLLSQ